MYCSIDSELVNRFADASGNYFAAVSKLYTTTDGTKDHGPSFHESYSKAMREREKCKRARRAVEEHRAEHRCQPHLQ